MRRGDAARCITWDGAVEAVEVADDGDDDVHGHLDPKDEHLTIWP